LRLGPNIPHDAPAEQADRESDQERLLHLPGEYRRWGDYDPAMAVAMDTLDQLRTAGLADVDPQVAELIGRELERQREQIELIASENFTWPAVLEAVGSIPTNKYAEGYPGRRYYGGCEVVDEIEQLAIDRARALFGAEHANVQPHAGAQTNMAVYFACLQPGDTILSLELTHGGHLTHGLKVNFSGRLYTVAHYGVSRETNRVDYDEVLALAKQHRPRLIVCGGSAYPRTVEADRFREIADEVGAHLLCDMAHFAGLVAAGLHPNPVPHCDFVTSTTHKTLAGPRSGFVLCREEHAQAVDRAVFPGMQGGPLMHVIAAKAACFRIAGTEAFRSYQAQIRANADALAETLEGGGLDVLTGGTDTHLLQVDLRRTNWSGKEAEERLDEVRITVNRNTVPFDERPPTIASGIRVGTPAATMRGFDGADFREVGAIMVEALGATPDVAALAARSVALCARRPLYPGFRGFTAFLGNAEKR
jgi:glycine hydroxymethyltransferase